MHQAVLVHAQIDERAKGRHVADCALQHHAFFQILDVFHAIVEARHLEIGARVAAGFFQLTQDVLDGDHAEGFVGKQLRAQGFEHVGAAHQLGHRLGSVFDDFLDHRVSLWVHAGHVQRVVAIADAQETRALLKGFCAQPGHQQ